MRPGEAGRGQVEAMARPGLGHGGARLEQSPRLWQAPGKLHYFQWLTSVVVTPKGRGGRAQRSQYVRCEFGGSARRCMVFPHCFRYCRCCCISLYSPVQQLASDRGGGGRLEVVSMQHNTRNQTKHKQGHRITAQSETS